MGHLYSYCYLQFDDDAQGRILSPAPNQTSAESKGFLCLKMTAHENLDAAQLNDIQQKPIKGPKSPSFF